ncbi:MAG: response regulator [Thiolinea sp.]
MGLGWRSARNWWQPWAGTCRSAVHGGRAVVLPLNCCSGALRWILWSRKRSNHLWSIRPCACLRRLRLLLVDDAEMNRFVGAAMLENLGAQVTLAADAEQATHYLQQDRFDAVLLDISMPGMDGFELTGWIREQARNPGVPVIALTAHALSTFEQRAYAVGMNGYLSKPFEYRDLYQAICRVLETEAVTPAGGQTRSQAA